MENIYIVSLYAEGTRRASDCIPEFFGSREGAIAGAAAWLEMARDAREKGDMIIGWPVRYTVRRERVSRREAEVIARHA